MRKLLVVLLGVVLGLSFSIGVAKIFNVYSASSEAKTYHVIFTNGGVAKIGAENYTIEGPCVVFHREGRSLAFCSVPIIIDMESGASQGKPTGQEGKPSGPSGLSPNDNFKADS